MNNICLRTAKDPIELHNRQKIYRAGQRTDHRAYLVLSGYVVLSHEDSKGRSACLSLLESGSTFGEEAMFGGTRRNSAVCYKNASIQVIDLSIPYIASQQLFPECAGEEVAARLKEIWLAHPDKCTRIQFDANQRAERIAELWTAVGTYTKVRLICNYHPRLLNPVEG